MLLAIIGIAPITEGNLKWGLLAIGGGLSLGTWYALANANRKADQDAVIAEERHSEIRGLLETIHAGLPPGSAERGLVEKAQARLENFATLRATLPMPTLKMTATVTTPESPQAPNNEIARKLNQCTTVEQCEELLARAKRQGYSEDGQTVKLIRAKIADLRGR